MDTYSLEKLPPATMTQEEYIEFKKELNNTKTIAGLSDVKNKINYTKEITIPLLKKLLDPAKKNIQFSLDYYLRSISNTRYVSKENNQIRAQTIFKKHIESILYKRLLLLLKDNVDSEYNKKLSNPITKDDTITKILLFAHGDYNSMYSDDLSNLIGLIIGEYKKKTSIEHFIVYTYDINELALPDFSNKEDLKAFTDEFGKFDAIVPINCFNPTSYKYLKEENGTNYKFNSNKLTESQKNVWADFVKKNYVDVINENIKPDGYIYTIGADPKNSEAAKIFFDHYQKKIDYSFIKLKYGYFNTDVYIIKLISDATKKQEAEQKAEQKAEQEAEQKAKEREAAEAQAKEDAEWFAKQEAEAELAAEEKAKLEAEKAKAEKAKAEKAKAEKAKAEKAKAEKAKAEKAEREEKAKAEREKLNSTLNYNHISESDKNKVMFIKLDLTRT